MREREGGGESEKRKAMEIKEEEKVLTVCVHPRANARCI